MNPKPNYFIVGMSRAGTTWLVTQLNQHKDLASYGETGFWGRSWQGPKQGGKYNATELKSIESTFVKPYFYKHLALAKNSELKEIRNSIRACFDQIEESQTPGEIFIRINKAIGVSTAANKVIEKTPHHINHIERIRKEIPDSRFIVMKRKAYSFLLSYKHQGDRKTEEKRQVFHQLYHPAISALIWRKFEAAIESASRLPDDSVFLADFDRIATEPITLLQEIFAFLDCDPDPEITGERRVNSSFEGIRSQELKAEDIFWMNRFNKRTIQRAGYYQPTPKNPSALLRISASFVSLAIWPLENFCFLKQISSGGLSYFLRYLRK